MLANNFVAGYWQYMFQLAADQRTWPFPRRRASEITAVLAREFEDIADIRADQGWAPSESTPATEHATAQNLSLAVELSQPHFSLPTRPRAALCGPRIHLLRTRWQPTSKT